MKNYFTMGQDHIHRINGQIVDKDTVLVVEAETHVSAREYVFEITDGRFCFSYDEDSWDEKNLQYFPKGYVYL